MNTTFLRLSSLGLMLVSLSAVAGCDMAEAKRSNKTSPREQTAVQMADAFLPHKQTTAKTIDTPLPKKQTAAKKSDTASAKEQTAAKAADTDPPKEQSVGKTIKVGKNVALEIDGDNRRVLVNAKVCLQRGMLEQFLRKAGTKEHESILSAAVDAKDIHTALLLAGAEAGSPVKFRPKYVAASGSVIKIFVQYDVKGKTVKVPAQDWIRNVRTEKELKHDWVFAGSMLYSDPTNPKATPRYAANDGDVICLANFETAMLDLPIESSQTNEDLDFEAWTQRIPAVDTDVLVILEPVVVAKKK